MSLQKPAILVAGATGSVGREVVRLARESGHRVTALSRNAGALRDAADRVIPFDATQGIPELAGHEVVISTLGAPVGMSHPDRRPFRAIDFGANLNILKGARRAGIERFIYVAAHIEQGYASTSYILAHEEFVNALHDSGIPYTVLRPTGIFSAFHDFVPMARRGLLMVLGDGRARTNPIHQADVAQACLDAIGASDRERNLGGPDILTRREIAELAFAAVGKRPRILRLPASSMELGGSVTRIFNQRLGEMLEFVARVATVDCIAPVAGGRKLSDYLNALAAEDPKT